MEKIHDNNEDYDINKLEDELTLLPKFNLYKYPKINYKTKFHIGFECIALGYMWLFTHYDKENKIIFGWVKIYEGEWGIIDLNEFKDTYKIFSHTLKHIFKLKETFNDGPKTIKELNEIFYGYNIEL